MIKKSMEKAINEQINAETYSAYLYWSMAAWCDKNNLPGFANWMRVQVQEEMSHAVKFYTYLIDRGGTVKLTAIAAPETDWKDIEAIFAATLKHEQYVTARINNLADLAIKEKDHAAGQFLQWFVNEQVEEEKNAEQILGQLKMMGKQPGAALYILDKEMAARVFTPPAAQAQGA
jgi:ferritin